MQRSVVLLGVVPRMNAASCLRAHSPFRWKGILACAASVLLTVPCGCCAGRVVSVQLYEGGPPAGVCAQCAGKGCFLCRGGLLARHGHAHGALDLTEQAGFRGPAFTAPVPRFHPVPTRPVFEPQDDHGSLQVLEPLPTPSGEGIPTREPTPAKPPGIVKP